MRTIQMTPLSEEEIDIGLAQIARKLKMTEGFRSHRRSPDEKWLFILMAMKENQKVITQLKNKARRIKTKLIALGEW